MSPALAEFIIEACNNADTFFEDEESMPTIQEGYSGRGMYGKETTAIVCKNIMPVMAAIVCEAAEIGTDEDGLTINGTYYECLDSSMLESIRHFQMDSMGRDSIVLY